jgi:hypothetical protein
LTLGLPARWPRRRSRRRRAGARSVSEPPRVEGLDRVLLQLLRHPSAAAAARARQGTVRCVEQVVGRRRAGEEQAGALREYGDLARLARLGVRQRVRPVALEQIARRGGCTFQSRQTVHTTWSDRASSTKRRSASRRHRARRCACPDSGTPCAAIHYLFTGCGEDWDLSLRWRARARVFLVGRRGPLRVG